MNYTIDVSRYDAFDISSRMIPVNWEASGFPLSIMKSIEGTLADPAFRVVSLPDVSEEAPVREWNRQADVSRALVNTRHLAVASAC
jgi:hypothetical protein